jgi:segregation and condensation protein A
MKRTRDSTPLTTVASQAETPLGGGDSYHVRLETFTGPLDLLLHLIKKNEINIYDIPIALITQQYLDYLGLMKTLNLTVAGEFLVMAATLIQIKSRMLLPADDDAAGDEDGPDPREELVRRLLEYKRFKEAAADLGARERIWREMFGRDPVATEPAPAADLLLEQVTVFDLVDALQGVLSRLPAGQCLEIMPDNLTVQDRMNAILEALEGEESITFLSLFESEHERHRLVIIVTFLALLELVRIGLIRVFQGEPFGPIRLARTFLPVDSAEGADL